MTSLVSPQPGTHRGGCPCSGVGAAALGTTLPWQLTQGKPLQLRTEGQGETQAPRGWKSKSLVLSFLRRGRCRFQVRIIESLSLEKTSEVIRTSYQPYSTRSNTEPFAKHLIHVFLEHLLCGTATREGNISHQGVLNNVWYSALYSPWFRETPPLKPEV